MTSDLIAHCLLALLSTCFVNMLCPCFVNFTDTEAAPVGDSEAQEAFDVDAAGTPEPTATLSPAVIERLKYIEQSKIDMAELQKKIDQGLATPRPRPIAGTGRF